MAVAMGFGQGNKNTPMSGSTGAQPMQLKMNPNGQLGVSTDGSGGMLNYLKGVINKAATPSSGVPSAADYSRELAGGPVAGGASSGGW